MPKLAEKAKKAAPKESTPPAETLDFTGEFEGEALADQVDQVNGLWVGDPGTGKTTDLATMANLGQIVFINAEAGLKARPLRKMGVNVDNIRTYPRQGEILTFEYLEKLFFRVLNQLQTSPGSVYGVVWDSITEIHKKVLDNVVTYAFEKSERQGKDRDRFFIDRADYGVMTEQMRLLLRRYRDLPCHFVATALQRRDQDDDGKVVYRPAVTPALANDLAGYMDVICYTSVAEIGGEDEYQGLFRPAGKFRGKDRFGAVPRRLVDPTFERVLGYVTEDLSIDTDPIMISAKELRAKLKLEEVDREVDDGGDAGEGE